MRISEFRVSTTREIPADAELTSHQLMLRAGLICKVSSGLYTWMPLGLRVLRKIENIIRQEMDAAGALEMLMPSIQPAELWKKSQRWDAYGPELLRIKDRHQRDFVFGPTHEEVITAIARQELKSYKQLPINYYQIQTKFRDEIRPRFGVMRAREFIMKDAYSFHIDEDSLNETYQTMYATYTQIFNRLHLQFRTVLADTGSIGGNESHEFHVLSNAGEDAIAFSGDGAYAANVELAPTQASSSRTDPKEDLTAIDTPGITTIQSLCEFLSVTPQQCLKALFVKGTNNNIIGIFIRGDHTLNSVKAQKHPLIASPLEFASETDIMEITGCKPGSLGPIKLDIPILADYTAAGMSDFICGANRDDVHYTGANWGRDTTEPQTADLRNIETGDPSPDGNGVITVKRGIEVGHIFKLGTKYSQLMDAQVLNRNGTQQQITMGCYGIGVSRIVAAAIEQNHDADGIIWPLPMAPFQVIIIPIQYHRSQAVRQTADTLTEQFENTGIEVLIDDRDLRAGEMFADADLIGIPYRLVISERGLKNKQIEYKQRDTKEAQIMALDNCVSAVSKIIQEKYSL